MSKRNRRVRAASITALVLLALISLWYFLSPLSFAEGVARVRLWRHGVKTADIRGLRAYIRRIGVGPTHCVALVHGAADSALTFEKVLESHEADWEHPVTLYAFDLPGSGHSPAPADKTGYQVRQQAEALRRALEPTCTTWVVVGNSLGGWVASWLAHDWPAGVGALMLTDAVALKDDAVAAGKYFDHIDLPKLKAFSQLAFSRPPQLSEHIWKAAIGAIQQGSLQAVLDAQNESQFLDGQFTSWHVPTLVFWGEDDHLVPVASGKRLLAAIPGATWREVPACGHMPQKECPAEFIRAIDGLAGGIASP